MSEVVCQNFRELQSLVHEYVMGLPAPRAGSPKIPHYDLWRNLEPVCSTLQDRQLAWHISFHPASYPQRFSLFRADVVMPDGTTHTKIAKSAGVALCLAALASAGVSAKFEPQKKRTA